MRIVNIKIKGLLGLLCLTGCLLGASLVLSYDQSSEAVNKESANQNSKHRQLKQGSTDRNLTPSMRPVDRDWQYFKSIRCDDINRIVFHSRSEEILLAQRKNQCVNKYKAFLPTPVKR